LRQARAQHRGVRQCGATCGLGRRARQEAGRGLEAGERARVHQRLQRGGHRLRASQDGLAIRRRDHHDLPHVRRAELRTQRAVELLLGQRHRAQ
jgi:hypothetical protein